MFCHCSLATTEEAESVCGAAAGRSGRVHLARAAQRARDTEALRPPVHRDRRHRQGARQARAGHQQPAPGRVRRAPRRRNEGL